MSRQGQSGQSVVLNNREVKQLLQTITGCLMGTQSTSSNYSLHFSIFLGCY